MKHGRSFGESHKEGDTKIFWRDGRFFRVDQGDYPDQKTFTDETEFLLALRKFCSMNIARSAGPSERSDIDAWKLILRLLR